MPHDVAPFRTHGLTDSDLAGALGHRDEHDVHDADAAHEQRYQGNPHRRGEHDPGQISPYFSQRIPRDDFEVVRLSRRHLAFDAQDPDHLINRRVQLSGFLGLHGDLDILSFSENLLKCSIRHDYDVVLTLTENTPLFFHHSDHGKLLRTDADLLTDRIDEREQGLNDVFSDDDNRSGRPDVHRVEKPAAVHESAVDHLPFIRCTDDIDICIRLLAAVSHPLPPSVQYRRDPRYHHGFLIDGLCKVCRQILPISILLLRMAHLYGGVFIDVERIRSDLLELIFNGDVDAAYDRHHADDGHHADDDSESREHRAQLIRAEGTQGNDDTFPDIHGFNPNRV